MHVEFKQMSMPTQRSTIVHRTIARRLFAATLLVICFRGAICTASDRVSCAMPIEQCESPDGCSCGQCCECRPGICNRCFIAGKNCCCQIWRPIGNCVESIVCWPAHKICHLVNFCAPDGFVGPPDVMGPGRFHPVPTHPVFDPGPRPMLYPPQSPAE